MKQDLLASLRAAVVALLAFTVLTGLLYPALVYAIAQSVFPRQANGSLITDHGKVVGSGLIGQEFTHPGYFWGRLSALGPFPYNAMNSTGANYGPSDGHGKPNPAIKDPAAERIKALQDADPDNHDRVPADLVTKSSSGLDPHITPASANYQAGRVARIRGVPVDEIRRLIEQHTEGRTLGILGEPRVNVIAINRALDVMTGPPR